MRMDPAYSGKTCRDLYDVSRSDVSPADTAGWGNYFGVIVDKVRTFLVAHLRKETAFLVRITISDILSIENRVSFANLTFHVVRVSRWIKNKRYHWLIIIWQGVIFILYLKDGRNFVLRFVEGKKRAISRWRRILMIIRFRVRKMTLDVQFSTSSSKLVPFFRRGNISSIYKILIIIIVDTWKSNTESELDQCMLSIILFVQKEITLISRKKTSLYHRFTASQILI